MKTNSCKKTEFRVYQKQISICCQGSKIKQGKKDLVIKSEAFCTVLSNAMATDTHKVSFENQKQECGDLSNELMVYDYVVIEKASDSEFYFN